ncbi:TniQ family protein [Uliginosibacterium gangwonense]|uniref:TniQ family protein n=1 Tax=Uliginosibacterium gangwonense TaxID=392736 RepID=UPI00037D4291|nr:TniQ family protein [Uliginosibacterium gangwonense]
MAGFSCAPAPLPDELAQGHMARIFILAGIPERKRHSRSLSSLIGAASDNQKYLGQLADLSRMPLRQYIYSHTLVPFFKAVQEQDIDWTSESIQWQSLMISARKGATKTIRFCPQCVEQDLRSLGVSYWRRSHQLFGVSWCVEHLCGLYSTAADDAMRQLPEAFVSEGQADEMAEEFVAHPVLRRYGEICTGFLTLDAPINLAQMAQLIRDRARFLDLRGRLGSHGDHMDKLAIERTDRRWLQEYIPDVFTKGRASSICRTYSSTDLAYPAQYYALALALLFDSADDALAALNQAEIRLSLMSTPMGLRSADEERAISGFIAELPWQQLAEKYGLRVDGFEGLLQAALRHARLARSVPQAEFDIVCA